MLGDLRATLESGSKVAWHWDLATGRDTWLGDLRTMFGIDARRYEGPVEDFHRRVHPDDRARVAEAVAHARQHGTRYRAVFRVRRPDGVIRWVDATGQFHYARNGEPLRMLGIATDITEHHQMEEALRESETRFRVMADSAPVLLWTAGPDAACDYVNRHWLEFTGRPFDTQLGDGWLDGVHPDDRGRCLRTYLDAFDRRDPFEMEYRLRRHDGVYRVVLDAGVARFTPDGSFAGYIGSATDVTVLRTAQQASSDLSRNLIDAQERERVRLARQLDDDVMQYVALLAMDVDAIVRSLHVIPDEATLRFSELRARIVSLQHRVQAVSSRIHSSKLELLGLGSAAACLCRELAARHRVAIDFSRDDPLPTLRPDVSLALFRVLEEALANALSHDGTRRIAVALRQAEEGIELEISDAASALDRVSAHSGRSIGLIAMRERLALVGGTMLVESSHDGGTTLRARVPGAGGAPVHGE